VDIALQFVAVLRETRSAMLNHRRLIVENLDRLKPD